MNSTAVKIPFRSPATEPETVGALASDSRYVVSIARDATEVAGALRLRHEVFNRELGIQNTSSTAFEFDQYDLRCKHLIATERTTGSIVGTYRLNTIGENEGIDKFYSFSEFTLETIPDAVLRAGVEIGRACVSLEHRSSKALFLLWKGLAKYLTAKKQRYVFGCCSIFTSEPLDGARAYERLREQGYLHPSVHIAPRQNEIRINSSADMPDTDLPHLFEMYLRLGALVCGPPMYDPDFGSVDFFVLFDTENMAERYRRMFFS